MNHPKRLLVLGAGHAHVHLLKEWALNPPPHTQLTLVTPHARTFYSGMVPGFIAGHYRLDQCEIPIKPLVENAKIHWVAQHVTAINAQHQQVMLEDGSTLDYDFLSVDIGAATDAATLEATLPGAAAYGVRVRPLETLATQWDHLARIAQEPHISVAVVGGGAAGFELACALKYRSPHADVGLVTGTKGLCHSYPPKVRHRLLQRLQVLGIPVLTEDCVAIEKDAVITRSGQRIPSLQTWLATGSLAPAWLTGSELALDNQGFIAVNAFQQSVSHPNVFAAGDVATRMDHPHPRSGVYAVRAGPALALNLGIALGPSTGADGAAIRLRPHQLPPHTLNLLACGGRYAIASLGQWSAQGAWVWRWKDWIDRRFMRRYQMRP